METDWRCSGIGTHGVHVKCTFLQSHFPPPHSHSTSLLFFPQSSSDPLINLRPLVLHKSPVYGVRTRLGEGEKVDGREDGWAFRWKSGTIEESGDMVEKRQSPVVFYAYQRDRERREREERDQIPLACPSPNLIPSLITTPIHAFLILPLFLYLDRPIYFLLTVLPMPSLDCVPPSFFLILLQSSNVWEGSTLSTDEKVRQE